MAAGWLCGAETIGRSEGSVLAAELLGGGSKAGPDTVAGGTGGGAFAELSSVIGAALVSRRLRKTPTRAPDAAGTGAPWEAALDVSAGLTVTMTQFPSVFTV